MQARGGRQPVGSSLRSAVTSVGLSGQRGIDASVGRPELAATLVGGVLLASCLCLAVAPALMPEPYSLVEQAISDTAAQGVARAWVARFGFVLSALAILLLARSRARSWGPWGRSAHRVYAILVVGLATFSQRPWTGSSFNEFENLAHSILAPVAGVVFTAGVVLVSLHRVPKDRVARTFDGFTIVAMILLPIVMLGVSGLDGAAQRTAVAIGYLWYASEILRLARAGTQLPPALR